MNALYVFELNKVEQAIKFVKQEITKAEQLGDREKATVCLTLYSALVERRKNLEEPCEYNKQIKDLRRDVSDCKEDILRLIKAHFEQRNK